MEESCCFSGYRPEKFPFELKIGSADFNSLENKIYDAVFAAVRDGTDTFYCGMAMGFDLLCGKAVIDMKRMSAKNGIKLIAAIPFKNQSERYTPTWKKLYEIVLAEADKTVIISEEYHRGCFAERNKYMVDKSNRVITYYDGQSGGTANTLRYAASKGKNIINLSEYSISDVYNNYTGYQLELE